MIDRTGHPFARPVPLPDAPEPIVALVFGGTSEADQLVAFRFLHDQLVKANPVRLDAIRGNTYDASVADEKLTQAGFPPGRNEAADGLREWLAERPDCLLMICWVSVPNPGIGRA
jgi:hypothetical protein